MHIASPEKGSMLSTGIVGAGIPVAVGLALAAQLERLDRVVAVTFGDGATNTGSFHEAANMAALWNLPIVLICQNNLFAEKTPTDRTMKIKRIADRALAYGVPGASVDGNDPDTQYAAFAAAVDRARSGGGPSLVECVTFRLRGHSMGDDMRYVPKDQLAEAETHDPIPAYRQRLISDGVCTEDELVEIETAAATSVDAAVKRVLSAPDPSPAVGSGHRQRRVYVSTAAIHNSCRDRLNWVVSGPSLRCIGGAPISDPNVRDATESLDLLFARFQFGA